MRLILASGSPRRAEILRNAGFTFETLPAAVDESRHPAESPGEYVQRLAKAKAEAAAFHVVRSAPGGRAILIGADTVVAVADRVLGKPRSEEDARTMLKMLGGRAHEVHTGLAVMRLPDRAACVVEEITRVTLAPLAAGEIEDYLRSGEPFDKAGAYAIQGRAGRFVTRIEGCYYNVMGLPLARLCAILREMEPHQG